MVTVEKKDNVLRWMMQIVTLGVGGVVGVGNVRC